jgi:hypothetical protein
MAATFLLGFQEHQWRDEVAEASCGTKTLTETRESTDQDPTIEVGTLTKTNSREQGDQDCSGAAMATKTITAVRSEQSDEDAGSPATFRAVPLAKREPLAGTETVTKTREARDQDAAVQMGTRTGTRAREEDDQDASNPSYFALPR